MSKVANSFHNARNISDTLQSCNTLYLHEENLKKIGEDVEKIEMIGMINLRILKIENFHHTFLMCFFT